jgi:RNA polymerase sigma-70 factor (ECF subfamily)
MLGFGKKKQRLEFEATALPHMQALYAGAARMTGNARDAEDLVQDTYLKAFRFFHRYQPDTNIRAWLFKILTNTFINSYRRKARERDQLGIPESDAVLERAALPDAWGGFDDPERSLFTGAVSDEVQRAIEALPVDFRMAVVLRDLEDFSYQEIADMLECPLGTVMSRLYRGRRLLQRTLHEFAVREGYITGAPNAPAEQSPGTENTRETQPRNEATGNVVRLDEVRAAAQRRR